MLESIFPDELSSKLLCSSRLMAAQEAQDAEDSLPFRAAAAHLDALNGTSADTRPTTQSSRRTSYPFGSSLKCRTQTSPVRLSRWSELLLLHRVLTSATHSTDVLSLVITYSPTYPDELPEIGLEVLEGELDDEEQEQLVMGLIGCATDSLGMVRLVRYLLYRSWAAETDAAFILPRPPPRQLPRFSAYARPLPLLSPPTTL